MKSVVLFSKRGHNFTSCAKGILEGFGFLVEEISRKEIKLSSGEGGEPLRRLASPELLKKLRDLGIGIQINK